MSARLAGPSGSGGGTGENSRTRLGLRDPKVRGCLDRGDAYDPDEHPSDHTAVPDATLAPPPGDIIKVVRTELRNAQVSYPSDNLRFFVPRDILQSIMVPVRVRRIVDALPCCHGLSTDERATLANEICSGGKRWCAQPCRKLLAAAVSIGNSVQESFLELLRDKVTDACLPLQKAQKAQENSSYQMECTAGHRHGVLDDLVEEDRNLCLWTHGLSAPYFKRLASEHVHYILRTNDVLPIEDESSPGMSKAPGNMPSRHGIETLCAQMGGVKTGGFSTVKRVRFHPGHFNFDSDYLRLAPGEDGERSWRH